jgi:hypothetical protein
LRLPGSKTIGWAQLWISFHSTFYAQAHATFIFEAAVAQIFSSQAIRVFLHRKIASPENSKTRCAAGKDTLCGILTTP